MQLRAVGRFFRWKQKFTSSPLWPRSFCWPSISSGISAGTTENRLGRSSKAGGQKHPCFFIFYGKMTNAGPGKINAKMQKGGVFVRRATVFRDNSISNSYSLPQSHKCCFCFFRLIFPVFRRRENFFYFAHFHQLRLLFYCKVCYTILGLQRHGAVKSRENKRTVE